jgi:hypothetical protein
MKAPDAAEKRNEPLAYKRERPPTEEEANHDLATMGRLVFGKMMGMNEWMPLWQLTTKALAAFPSSGAQAAGINPARQRPPSVHAAPVKPRTTLSHPRYRSRYEHITIDCYAWAVFDLGGSGHRTSATPASRC